MPITEKIDTECSDGRTAPAHLSIQVSPEAGADSPRNLEQVLEVALDEFEKQSPLCCLIKKLIRLLRFGC